MSRSGFQLPAIKAAGEWAFNKQRFQELANELSDGDYLFVVERAKKKGSARQRGYYFAVIVRGFAEYWGVDDDDAHELIKQHCNTKVVEVVNKQTGESEEQTIGASTAGMTVEQWKAFIDRCHVWAATEFGFVIPDADPEYVLHRYEREAR